MKVNLIVFLFSLLFGCGSYNHNTSNINSEMQSSVIKGEAKCSKSIVNDTLRQNLLKLNYSVFDTILIKQIFDNPIVISYKKVNETGSSFYCAFKSGNSEACFSGNNYKQEFYLDYAKIMDNSIKLNYNILIGMDKKTFFINIKQPLSECDSINILDDTSNNLYLFDNGKLKEIIVTTGI